MDLNLDDNIIIVTMGSKVIGKGIQKHLLPTTNVYYFNCHYKSGD